MSSIQYLPPGTAKHTDVLLKDVDLSYLMINSKSVKSILENIDLKLPEVSPNLKGRLDRWKYLDSKGISSLEFGCLLIVVELIICSVASLFLGQVPIALCLGIAAVPFGLYTFRSNSPASFIAIENEKDNLGEGLISDKLRYDNWLDQFKRIQRKFKEEGKEMSGDEKEAAAAAFKVLNARLESCFQK